MNKQHARGRKRLGSGLFLAAAAAALWPIRSAQAATDTWTSTTGGNWTTTGDWSSHAAPTAGQDVSITTSFTGSQTITFNSALGLTYNTVTVDATGGGTNTLLMSANNLNVSDYEVIGNTGVGSFNQTGGSNTIASTSTFGFYLGNNTSGAGSYTLANGATLSSPIEYIGAAGSGTFNQNGGSNTVSQYLDVTYFSGSTGEYTLSNGTLNASSEEIGYGGTGTFTQNGGTNTDGGLSLGVLAGSAGSYTLTNGIVGGADEYIGGFGSGSFIQNGGTNSIAGESGLLVVAVQAGGTGSYTLNNAGTLNSAEIDVGGWAGGAGGAGTFTQTGGTLTTSTLVVGYSSVGQFSISGGTLNASDAYVGYSAGGFGIFSVSGSAVVQIGGELQLVNGILNVNDSGIGAGTPLQYGSLVLPASGQTAAIESLGGAGINGAGLDMNGGGTLLLIGTNNFYSGGTTIASGSTIQVGGPGGGSGYSAYGSIPATGNVDDEGSLFFCQSNNIILSGVISGAGAVVEAGSGTTTLSGINTYSGQTNVFLGTLAVSGELYHGVGSAPNVNVSGGTLAGTGTIHSGITLNYGTIAPGLAGSTLSADGSLTDNGGNLQFDVGTNSASMLALGGTASFAGDATVTFTLSGAPVSGSVFTILTSTGLSGTGSLDLTPTVIGPDTLTPSVSGNNLIVTVSGALVGPASLTWNNAGGTAPSDGQTWDISNYNWNNGSAATLYADGDNVTFNDSNNATSNEGYNPNAYNVTLNSAVSPASIVVNNSLGDYTITGTGIIADAGAFTKSGTGTLTLGTALSVGSMSITAGTVKLASGVSGGTGPAVTSTIDLTSVSITGTGQLDVNNNHIIITYGATDPFSTIANYIASGYNGGHWNGPGIISTAAQTKTNGLSYGLGYADGADGKVSGLVSGQIEVAYTLLGDANLDGIVNAADFTILAANFNQPVTGWDQGDFNYDGIVNAADFTDLAANFNQSDSGADVSAGDVAALDAFATANGLSLPTSSVPEPATTGLLAMGAIGMLARRRRRST